MDTFLERMMPFKAQHFYFLTLVGYLIPGHDVSAAPHHPSTHKVTSHFPSNEYTSLSFSSPYLTDVMSLMMAAGSSPLSHYSVTLDTASTPTSSRDALTLMTSRAGPCSSSQIRSHTPSIFPRMCHTGLSYSTGPEGNQSSPASNFLCLLCFPYWWLVMPLSHIPR